MLLDRAKTFKDLSDIALAVMNRMPTGIEMISGPISTGGLGTPELNLKVFSGVIEILIEDYRLNMLSQMPFEAAMGRFAAAWRTDNPGSRYCMPILDDFYDRVFSTGKVLHLHFLHDWESSFGATWEHDNCERWGIKRIYLEREISLRALRNVETAIA